MKNKKRVLSGIIALLLVVTSQSAVFASTNRQNIINNDSLILVEDKDSLTNGLSKELIDKADNYIKFTGEKYKINNVEKLKSEISQREFTKVQNSINDMNSVFSEFTEEDWSMANISSNNTVSFGTVDLDSEMLRSGRNGIEAYWWGYKLLLNDNLTNTTAQALTFGAGAATLVALWAPWISAPTALVKAIASSVALAFGGAAAMFYRTNKGNGVYLRFTAYIVYTGMFAQ